MPEMHPVNVLHDPLTAQDAQRLIQTRLACLWMDCGLRGDSHHLAKLLTWFKTLHSVIGEALKLLC